MGVTQYSYDVNIVLLCYVCCKTIFRATVVRAYAFLLTIKIIINYFYYYYCCNHHRHRYDGAMTTSLNIANTRAQITGPTVIDRANHPPPPRSTCRSRDERFRNNFHLASLCQPCATAALVDGFITCTHAQP